MKPLRELSYSDMAYVLLLAVAIILAICSKVFADYRNEVVIHMDIIAQIESDRDPHAISCAGAVHGRGMYQVSEICLVDYNVYHFHEMVTIEQLFLKNFCLRVAKWYINVRIPSALRKWGIADTVEARLACYNWGMGNFKKYCRGLEDMPKETRNYIKKYNKLLERSQDV